MLNKIIIANRGEIALRILRTCKELGIKTVAVYSTVDRYQKHVLLADESICIGLPQPKNSYLNIPAIISAAEITGSDAIHPGYGFLSENANFAEQVENSGFVFIGPKPETIHLMGNKISAINTMKKIGMPCVPGPKEPIKNTIKKNIKIAESIGYPIIIKSANGGGGIGIKIAYNNKHLEQYINIIQNQFQISCKNNEIYIEKYIDKPRHIEIQIISDGEGNVIYLAERDCSIQYKHKKLIEEAPILNINKNIKKKIIKYCIKACIKIKYRGVGTFEFLYKNDKFYFIEMNTRIQVEHTITEMITNIDIVKEQIKISSGYPLLIKQENLKINGYAIECRINAEDPNKFIPNSGKITHFHAPGGLGVRWESHIYTGYTITNYYDSMIGKLITYGKNRETAIAKMKNALEELIIEGIKNNIELHKKIIKNKKFKKGKININFLKKIIKNKK
ncbi:acetyl-CoA carboxylase biotin carboxylase subunit [Candidatus Purcelliella pentastirinorum]|uniref:acetyl-CoA carboxylase biotin carboxylase subunit n=1 Tax=Candidatus Purcelliella pentastirinorum TaxID=472834 RepID=UPI0023676FB5|nr:acetyl-CoA carboxylase biotin carboxylase subunit [Candidatus Purcelliella pentastirinorum]WDI79066.1 acetyl-CoA carboxylase biotin carboxylase subunit [Candidatus Purcelliella pentastirinorum]WDR80204.1 acetyl-CoA carboxylase biotin carboxylase subunit [Candidatus Purcelliella pentastirinorum]